MMVFARWVFRIAGIYGFVVLAPMFFSESQLAPGARHPVYFYAWLSLDLTWQVLFLVLSTAPIRYRPMMLVSVLEKASAVILIPWLYVAGRVGGMWLGAAAADLVFAGLFIASYGMTRGRPGQDGA
ncbi:MAG: hypothetical protein JXQ27_05135 [Acidobacteria bacterium]|nr:hypothetical protein [Acidobacteriota bacterium]